MGTSSRRTIRQTSGLHLQRRRTDERTPGHHRRDHLRRQTGTRKQRWTPRLFQPHAPRPATLGNSPRSHPLHGETRRRIRLQQQRREHHRVRPQRGLDHGDYRQRRR